MKQGLTILVALCCLVMATLAAAPAYAGKRVALVIGNSQYKDDRLRLPNPKNDAEDVGKALTDLGFTVSTATDLDIASFDEALAKFKVAAQDAEVGLFFYAGHAVQFDHINYFIPVDAVIERPEHLKRAAVSLDDIQDALKNVQGVQVMILDSCRDNPFSSLKLATRALAITRGLERIQVGSGDSVILYSTRANEVALDGADTRNSPFSSALVDQLKQPGHQELGSMLQQVAAKVKSRTGGKQSPELTMSISGDYYFDLANDRLEWDSVKNSLDPTVLRNFAVRFPESTFRREAERRATVYETQRAQRLKEDEDRRQREIDEARKQEEEHLRSVCALGNQLLGILVDGRDLEGLKRLSGQNACPSLREPIDQAILALTNNARQAKCDKVDDDLRRAAAAGNDQAAESLRADAGACPGLPDRIAKALDDIRATRDQARIAADHRRVCDAEQANLDTLRSSDGADRITVIARLGNTATCDTVRQDAAALALVLQAEATKKAREVAQAAACSAEAKTLDTLASQGPRSAIEALGRSHQCVTLDVGPTLAKFDSLQQQRRQQLACADEGRKLDALSVQGPRSAIEALARTHQCETLDATQALAKFDRAVEQARLDAACSTETKTLDGLVIQGPRSALEALDAAHQCPTLDVGQALAKFDGLVEQRRQQALAACAAVDVGRIRDAGDVKGLNDLLARCPSRGDAVAEARATIESKRKLADACQREKTELQGYVSGGKSDAVAALQARATCPDLDFDTAGRQIAKAACDTDLASVARVSGTDQAALDGLAKNDRLCPDARTQAAARLNSLIATRQGEDQACDAAVAQAATKRDATRLQRLSADARCDRRKAAIASMIDDLRTAEQARVSAAKCDADAAALAKIGADDDRALRSFINTAQACDGVRTAATSRLSTLVAARDSDDRTCDTALDTAAAQRNLDALQRLKADRTCIRRQQAVAAKITDVQTAERERIRVAQRQLAVVGCYAGPASGQVDDATRRAIGAYWAIKHQGETAPTVISVDLSTELGLQTAIVCPPAVQPTLPPVTAAPPPVVSAPPAKAPEAIAKAEPENAEASDMIKQRTRARRPVEPKDTVERQPIRKPRAKPEAPIAQARRPVHEFRTRLVNPRPAVPSRPAPAVTAEPSAAPKPPYLLLRPVGVVGWARWVAMPLALV